MTVTRSTPAPSQTAIGLAGRCTEARFTDLGPGWHDEQAGRDRKIRNHLRQLKALGIEVTVNTPTA
jgi:hypothetical protein